MKYVSVVFVVVLAALSVMSAPGVATAKGDKVPAGESSSTTLDACGYFVGIQTSKNAREYTEGGVTSHSEKGTWVGVTNNYGNGPVGSIGEVKGSYQLETATDSSGAISGTESFNSGDGKIEQEFSFAPATGWTVSVTATRNLAFLTSDTNGQCYTGPFPRP